MRSVHFLSLLVLGLAVSLAGCVINRNATKTSNDKQYDNPQQGTQESQPTASKSPRELDTIPDASEVKELND